MRGHRVGAEPGRHIAAGQLRELADGADTHTPQQICQLIAPGCGQARFGGQLPDGQCRQEPRVPAGFDDPAGTGGEDRGGQLVGDTDLAFGARRGHRVDQPLGGGLFGAEVAGRPADREHQQARPQHLRPGHQVVHGGRHVLEMPGVACRIGGDDVEFRTPGLRLTAAQTAPHPDRPGRCRTGDHPVGQRDRHRAPSGPARRGRRGDRGPVHAPDGQHPGGTAPHSPTALAAPTDRPHARMANRTRPITEQASAPAMRRPGPAPVIS